MGVYIRGWLVGKKTKKKDEDHRCMRWTEHASQQSTFQYLLNNEEKATLIRWSGFQVVINTMFQDLLSISLVEKIVKELRIYFLKELKISTTASSTTENNKKS